MFDRSSLRVQFIQQPDDFLESAMLRAAITAEWPLRWQTIARSEIWFFSLLALGYLSKEPYNN